MVKNPPARAGDLRDSDFIPGSGKSPAIGNGNLLQYSSLKNFMDRGAWQAAGSQKTEHDFQQLKTGHD